MASTQQKRSRAYTPPKGAPTPTRSEFDEAVRRANRRVTYQWAAVVVLGLVVFALVVVYGSGTGGNLPTGGGGHAN